MAFTGLFGQDNFFFLLPPWIEFSLAWILFFTASSQYYSCLFRPSWCYLCTFSFWPALLSFSPSTPSSTLSSESFLILSFQWGSPWNSSLKGLSRLILIILIFNPNFIFTYAYRVLIIYPRVIFLLSCSLDFLILKTVILSAS